MYGGVECVILNRAADDLVQIKMRNGHTKFVNIGNLTPILTDTRLKSTPCPFCKGASSEVKMDEEMHIGKAFQCKSCGCRFYQDEFASDIATVTYSEKSL